MLSTLDLIIVAAYILAMTLFGLKFTRQQKDRKAYFVGDRNVGWFLVLISIVATETSAVTFLSVPGLAFGSDPAKANFTFLQLSIGYIIGRCVVAWFLLPQYMSGELFSAYEVLRKRFNPAVQRVASALFLVTRTIADGLRIFLTALLLKYVGISVIEAVLLVGFVTIVYTYLGGMKAVLWTDLIQFVIKIAGAALAGYYAIMLLPGGWDQLVADGTAAGKFTLFDFSFNLTSDSTFWAGVLGGAVFSMASHGADQLMVQRYLCAGTLRNARVALVLSGFVIFVQFALFLTVGVGMFVLWKSGGFPELAAGFKPDSVFPAFIVHKLPIGIRGLLVAAVLAAAMSTLSSSLNSSANAFITDFYRPLRPQHDERWYVFLSRIMTAVWGVAQMGVAIIAYEFGGDESIVRKVLGVAGMTMGLLLGLFILGSLKRPVRSASAIAGLIVGFIVIIGVWLPGQLGTPILAWPWFAPVGAGTTVVVALLVNSVTRTDGSSAAPRHGSP